MNYLKQINGFWIWRKLNTISHVQMDLYFAILDCANTALWRENFSIPNSTLMNLCQISKTQLFNARNQLVQLELISYKQGKKGQAGTYTITPLNQTDFKTNFKTDFNTNAGTGFSNINKENINKNNFKRPSWTNYNVYEDDYDHEAIMKLSEEKWLREEREQDEKVDMEESQNE